MKKKIIFLIFLCFFAAILSACSNREPDPVIYFESNGGRAVASVEKSVAVFPYTSREGYEIEGWYLDSAFCDMAEFPFTAEKDVTLYARWVSVVDGNREIEYERTEDGTGVYAVSLNSKAYSVCIPDSHYGAPVLGIKRGFLSKWNYVHTFIIGKNVRTIEDVFYKYTKLTRIEVSKDNGFYQTMDKALFDRTTSTLIAYPRGLSDISYTVMSQVSDTAFYYNDVLQKIVLDRYARFEDGAFSTLSALKEFKVDANNTHYSEQNGVLYSKEKDTLIAYPQAKSGESFTIPDDVKTVKENAFSLCSLKEITLGKDVENFNDYSEKPYLQRYTVKEGNPVFTGYDGILYRQNGAELYLFPQGVDGKAELPDGVKSIGKFAFAEAKKLSEVVIPDSLEEIGSYAFRSCKNLNKVTFEEGSNVRYISEGAFAGCASLKKIILTSRIPPETGSGVFAFANDDFSIVIPANAKEIYAIFWNFAYGYFKEEGLALPTYTVTFESNGGSETAPVHGVLVAAEPRPTKEGMIFEGWYTDEMLSLNNKVDFPYVITDHIALYARWEYDLTA